MLLGLGAAGCVGLVASWRPGLAAVEPPAPAGFDRGSVVRGAAVSRLGDCTVCHTAEGGRPFAGGRPIPTPFGVVYASNITPDPRTGIGRWSFTAFRRAMTQGVSRNGAHLYPAFPYDHFTHVAEADLRDLYAFQMTREPVRASPPPNRMVPPLGFRPLLAGWKLLFFRPGPLAPAPGLSAEESRGRQLAEGLGHCGACHSPRNALGAEERGRAYDGGWSEGWWAPPLNARSPAARAWTADRLYAYLRTGLDPQHAAAAGPMAAVARDLSGAPKADVRAIAAYFAHEIGSAPAARAEAPVPDRADAAARAEPEGARLYAGACATCHEPGAGMVAFGGRPPLPLGTPLHEPNGRDTIQIVLRGLSAPVGRSGPYMPGFATSLDDRQVAAVVAYLRARHGDGPPWRHLEREVARARKEAGA